MSDLAALRDNPAFEPLPPGSAVARRFCAALSRSLLDDPRTRPHASLQALGYWLRPAAVERMIEKYLSAPPAMRRVPAGTVFQIPPANVESLFGYTGALSLLCGNRTLIRLPGADRPAQRLLHKLMEEAVTVTPELDGSLHFLAYGHNDAVTAALSALCDIRLVWGGDATVAHIASLALPPGARERGFGDRFSALAVAAEAYLAADSETRAGLAGKACNDIYVFDQLACASPRLMLWIGTEAAGQQAAMDFYPRLAAAAARRGAAPDVAAGLARFNAACLALHDLPATSYAAYGTTLVAVTLADLDSFSPFKRVAYGYGLLPAAVLPTLAALAAYTEPRDQTLAVWGFGQDTLAAFAAAPKNGFHRVVPAGQALNFDPIWDGCNLFDIMTRLEPA